MEQIGLINEICQGKAEDVMNELQKKGVFGTTKVAAQMKLDYDLLQWMAKNLNHDLGFMDTDAPYLGFKNEDGDILGVSMSSIRNDRRGAAVPFSIVCREQYRARGGKDKNLTEVYRRLSKLLSYNGFSDAMKASCRDIDMVQVFGDPPNDMLRFIMNLSAKETGTGNIVSDDTYDALIRSTGHATGNEGTHDQTGTKLKAGSELAGIIGDYLVMSDKYNLEIEFNSGTGNLKLGEDMPPVEIDHLASCSGTSRLKTREDYVVSQSILLNNFSKGVRIERRYLAVAELTDQVRDKSATSTIPRSLAGESRRRFMSSRLTKIRYTTSEEIVAQMTVPYDLIAVGFLFVSIAGIMTFFVWRRQEDPVTATLSILGGVGIALPTLIIKLMEPGWDLDEIIRRKKSFRTMRSFLQSSGRIDGLILLKEEGPLDTLMAPGRSCPFSPNPTGSFTVDEIITLDDLVLAGFKPLQDSKGIRYLSSGFGVVGALHTVNRGNEIYLHLTSELRSVILVPWKYKNGKINVYGDF